jgi:polar amino acid transport system substrate-binding protein
MKKKLLSMTLLLTLTLMFAVPAFAGPVLDRIMKRGELVVGTSGTQPPMTAKSKKGEIIGMDADLSRAMAASMGVKLKYSVMPFDKLLPALQAGQVDIVLSGMTITGVRNTKVAFVGPYFVTGKGILAVADKFASLKESHGLDTPEVTVAALKNSTSQKFAETMISKAKLVLTNSYDEAINLLLKGKTDVIVADYAFCALTSYRYQDKGLIAGASPLTYEPLGIAMVEDALLINWVQNFMTLLHGTGEIEKMHEKWLNAGSWIDDLQD